MAVKRGYSLRYPGGALVLSSTSPFFFAHSLSSLQILLASPKSPL